MRCSKCGWPNRPNETNCTKCGAPLVRQAEDTSAETRIESSGMTMAQQTVFEDKTVIQQPLGADRAQAAPGAPETPKTPAPHAPAQEPRCPKCGYPTRQGVSVCPNCKTVLHKPAAEAPQHDSHNAASSQPATGHEPQNPAYGETVNPYLQELHTAPSFSLTPIRRHNEQSAPGSNDYEGDEVLLTRANTDRDNTSITSRTQAVVTHDDGKWYIEDRSSQNTTFVQARHKTELHDGDTILLGDRLFTFHE